jgi:hypothetical protein
LHTCLRACSVKHPNNLLILSAMSDVSDVSRQVTKHFRMGNLRLISVMRNSLEN